MKILPVIGWQKGAQEFWCELQKLGIREEFDKPDKIIVLGGDGTLLGAQRDYYKMKKPFVGVGFGSVNFLLNRNLKSPAILYKKLQEDQWVQFVARSMRAEIRAKDGACKGIAFNDIYLKAMNPTGVVRLELNTKEYPRADVSGDGLIIATPQGSTAYNRNAGGTILPLDSTLWCLTGICTQKKLRVTIVQQRINVRVVRGDAVLVTDNKVFYNVQEIDIVPSIYTANICFDAEENFEQRRYNE